MRRRHGNPVARLAKTPNHAGAVAGVDVVLVRARRGPHSRPTQALSDASALLDVTQRQRAPDSSSKRKSIVIARCWRFLLAEPAIFRPLSTSLGAFHKMLNELPPGESAKWCLGLSGLP